MMRAAQSGDTGAEQFNQMSWGRDWHKLWQLLRWLLGHLNPYGCMTRLGCTSSGCQNIANHLSDFLEPAGVF